MFSKVKHLSAVLAVLVPLTVVGAGCESYESKGNERWVTTENTNVAINWDKVNEAYKAANGPEDLEKRINEIYEGDEVISVGVQDVDDKTQVVTGFFDKNTNGAVDDGEKIFTIQRELKGEGQAQIQTTGYGPYYGYTSPLLSIASGMLLGSMMSSMFMPGYSPMYRGGYYTPASRVGQIAQSRSAYRAANPSQFQRSQSGRTYNRPSSTTRPTGRTGGGFRSGGGRFGVATKGAATRLDA